MKNALRLFVLLLTVSANALIAAPLFRRPIPLDLGPSASDAVGPMVAADFNGDGRMDVAAVCGDSIITIFNDGGSFLSSARWNTVPLGISGLDAGDVDGDGDVDLVYNRGGQTGQLNVLLNAGSGTFSSGGSAIATTAGPLALADVNGDGKRDAVTVSGPQSAFVPKISVHLGNGSGGFAAAVQTNTTNGLRMKELALSDLNGDGRADVILGGEFIEVHVSTNVTGGLAFSWGGPSGAMAVGRLNADVHADLIVREPTLSVPSLRVFHGTGNGTFVAGTSIGGLVGEKLAIADFTGDGKNDIVSSGQWGTAIVPGLGNGTFAPQLLTAGSARTGGSVVVGDFDGDSRRDIVSSATAETFLRFLHGNGDGTFRDDRAFRVANYIGETKGISARDVNGDGRPDVTTVATRRSNEQVELIVLRNDGGGSLLAPVATPVPLTQVVYTVSGYLDGDSIPDAVIVGTGANGAAAAVYLGNFDGTFDAAPVVALTAAPTTIDRVRIAEITGDGKADLLIGNVLHEGNGDGSFDAGRTPGPRFDVIGDLNGDGRPDVLWYDPLALKIASALNIGDGNFAQALRFAAGTPRALGDFNGDGKLDLAGTGSEGVFVMPGRGDGTFETGTRLISDQAWIEEAQQVSAIDFNGDGNLDLAFGPLIFMGDGAGAFRSLEREDALGEGAIADFDGNGTPDVASSGGMFVFVQRTGLARTPTFPRPLSLESTGTPEHATARSYEARSDGQGVTLQGSVLFSVANAPFALIEMAAVPDIWLPNTLSRATVARALPSGTHTIGARYGGSETYSPSVASATVQIERATTAIYLPSDRTIAPGNPLTLWVTFEAPVAEGLPEPDAHLEILDNGVPVTDAQWVGPEVTLPNLAPGSHTLTFSYPGNAHYEPSSDQMTVTVIKRVPMITYFDTLPSGGDRRAGPFSLIVELSFSDGSPITGTVAFSLDGSPVGTVPLDANRAQITISMTTGQHTIGFQYSGDVSTEPVSRSETLLVYLPPSTPVPVSATYENGQVYVRWLPVANVYGYWVYQRTSMAEPWQRVGNFSSNMLGAAYNAPPGVARMFAVAPYHGGENVGPLGPPDLVTTVTLPNSPMVAGTRIQANQLTQLRQAMQTVRTFAQLPTFTFTDAITAGAKVRAVHFLELREALAQARSSIGMPISFSSPAPAVGGPVRALHVEELYAGVR